MTGQNKDMQRLQHIVDYCMKINDVFDALQGDYDRFADRDNYQPRDLCCFYILQIGELSSGLSEEFKKSHEEIPWRSIKGMRNIVAHRYGTIDLGTVWEVLTDDIPALERQCRAILSTWDSDFTKLAPAERARLDESERDWQEGKTVSSSEIDWN